MNQTRTNRKTCRFTPEEIRLLERGAREAKMRLSSYVRECALSYLKQKYLVPIGVEDKLTELTQKIVRIGNNHDRILAKASTLQKVSFGDILKANRALYEAENLLLSFLRNPKLYDG